jgi:hypothetical protein
MGKESNKDEKQKGKEVANDLAAGGGKVFCLDQGVNDGEEEQPAFWNHLPGVWEWCGAHCIERYTFIGKGP